MDTPCRHDPDLWFAENPDPARIQCLLACPLAAQRACAQVALDASDHYGVWAGVALPGRERRAKLDSARVLLRKIAEGLPPTQLKYNQKLLREHAETLRRQQQPRPRGRNLSICA